jgi:8-oxo-dGTP pyrophosphatase MutT (NUDIX family)
VNAARPPCDIDDVALTLAHDSWAFSNENAAHIAAFWREKRNTHPHYFNGSVHVLQSWSIRDEARRSIVGELMRTDFASFLYWRERTDRRSNGFDFSGAGAVVCDDGALLLVVSGDHTIAPGTLEFPSGMVDDADFDEHGRLNFLRHVGREVSEELSLAPAQIGPPMRYLTVSHCETVQVVSVFRARLASSAVVDNWRRNVAATQSEIADVVAVSDVVDMEAYNVPRHVETAASVILADIRKGR